MHRIRFCGKNGGTLEILEAKAEISVSGSLAKYTHKAGETWMNKTISYKSTYMFQLFKPRNTAITNDERNRAALIMYENYICKYKAILLQCERDYDLRLVINVRPLFLYFCQILEEVILGRSSSIQKARQTKTPSPCWCFQCCPPSS